jgi:single-strand DNA-binding protein
MAIDLNKVMILGRCASDLEVKKIESTGSSVVNFTVATNRKYKNKDGNLLEEAEYHRCVAYGNSADVLGKYLTKGKKLYVEGRLKTRKWQDSTGNDRYSTEIVLENFIFLDAKWPQADGDHGDIDYHPESDIHTDDLPF